MFAACTWGSTMQRRHPAILATSNAASRHDGGLADCGLPLCNNVLVRATNHTVGIAVPASLWSGVCNQPLAPCTFNRSWTEAKAHYQNPPSGCRPAAPAAHGRQPARRAERRQLADALQPWLFLDTPAGVVEADLHEADAICQPCSGTLPGPEVQSD
jgi:hypothetical protein